MCHLSHPRTAILLFALAMFVFLGDGQAQSSIQSRPYASETDLIEVMFSQDSRVRLREGVLVDLENDALRGVEAALSTVRPYSWSRICDVEEAILDRLQTEGAAKSGTALHNLNNIYRLRFTAREGVPDVWSLSASLEALPGILYARPVPLPMELPVPDYEPAQGYLFPATSIPTGIDAQYAWTVPGGNGTGITICDIEYSWNDNHDDLTKAQGMQINSFVQDPFADNNHGTAVLGEMISDDNAPNWGTKGICPGASVYLSGSYFGVPAPSWNPAGAIAVALAYLKAGDVVLLEQQWDYTGSNGFVPIEWWLSSSPNPQFVNSVYAAIQTAIANGIYVVEAGGNGNMNTDLMTWVGDSRAIIVGAGGAYPGGTWPEGDLERLSFSSYGNRFNLQGWGEDVVTTGYGDLYNLEGIDRYYTNTFDGTSSASPIVAGAVACCAGYYRASISMTPLAPLAMRALLTNSGTPQIFGPPGRIGPRPNLMQAIQWMGGPTYDGDWGDAPEDALAYPATGGWGFFPTCGGGSSSFVLHGNTPPFQAYFGPMEDYENNGNAGNCPNFPPYDADECFRDGDAGLVLPGAFTIQGGVEVPCGPFVMPMGQVCSNMTWGTNVDIGVNNTTSTMVYVNVLMDWDGSGTWGGSMPCPGGLAREHVLVDFPVPAGFSGRLSSLSPPSFLSGAPPAPGFFWSRFSLTEVPVGQGWDGSGTFALGETEDYLLMVFEEATFGGDYGDAPEGAIAYPWLGVNGAFPTCYGGGPAGYVIHFPIDGYPAMFGNSIDYEPEGNAGNCPNFPPYDADECYQDGDAGLTMPPAYTIVGGSIQPCSGHTGSLGSACAPAMWGTNLDIWVDNTGAAADAYVNVLFDWNQDGQWRGFGQCPAGAAPEHVLWNFQIPQGYAGLLSGLNPPAFMIGPRGGYVWSRFTISYAQLPFDWDGHWVFAIGGETEDYLLHVQGHQEEYGDYGDAPEGALAYPSLGILGQFPTCAAAGPAGFVLHLPVGSAWFGGLLDFEVEGNAGNCASFPPYDADECFNDPDAGLIFPSGYTIDNALNIVPCVPTQTRPLGYVCTPANWGSDIDIMVTNTATMPFYVNMLIDWNQDGQWRGSSQCPTAMTPEHVMVNFVVPPGFTGPLSLLGPPSFLIGPQAGFVWSRFTVSYNPITAGWDGAGVFTDGESEDYLLRIVEEVEGDYGDAPEGATAYPELGVLGAFPTCTSTGPGAFVVHGAATGPWFGPGLDIELDGNAGNCPNFPPYDADECFNDGDAGLLRPLAYSLDAALNYVACLPPATGSLGNPCSTVVWGGGVDIDVHNPLAIDVHVNVLMDWNRDGRWAGASACPDGPVPEHVLVDFVVPAGFAGPLSLLMPPAFTAGPDTGYVWTRFTISEQQVGGDWRGGGNFQCGETEDYLLHVAPPEPSDIGDTGGGRIRATRILACRPSPFTRTTTVVFEIDRPQEVDVSVRDINGRHVRTLRSGVLSVGRYEAIWMGDADDGRPVAAGVYFLTLKAGGERQSQPIILLR
ncbi:MAG: S8 family serine peptidase [Candidatus Eisenbacteria bacterium]|nr:S8 family serine peptidase [Candidatus Eisenbacteria bacterium]